MNRTSVEQNTTPICVSTKELMKMLGCGRVTAERIGIEADARIRIGRRILYNVKKIQKYIDNLECQNL